MARLYQPGRVAAVSIENWDYNSPVLESGQYMACSLSRVLRNINITPSIDATHKSHKESWSDYINEYINK